MRPRSSLLLAVVVVASVLSGAGRARAQRYASGLYAEMELGATGFIGSTAEYVAPGVTFGLRGGYDLFSWFSVGGIVTASTHEATVPPPPDEEYFQIYMLGADGRLSARLGRVAIFGEGALGFAAISTNVLDRVAVTEPDNRVGTVFLVGGGVNYHVANRHFSLGLAADWTLYAEFSAAQSVTGRVYLRYTR